MDYLQKIFFELPIFVSFLGGLLTFFTPCILPLIPSYMSYISGVALSDISNHSKSRMFQSSLLFVFGFACVFFLLFLATLNIVGNFFASPYVRYLSGSIVIIFGLHFLGVIKIGILHSVKQLNLSKLEQSRALKAILPLLIGVGFAAGWTPCTGPIVSSIALLASTNPHTAILSSLSFILGLSTPFLLLSVFLEKGLMLIKRLKKQMQFIEIICGGFLIFVGFAIIFRLF